MTHSTTRAACIAARHISYKYLFGKDKKETLLSRRGTQMQMLKRV